MFALGAKNISVNKQPSLAQKKVKTKTIKSER
jgi:hypothetical protein